MLKSVRVNRFVVVGNYIKEETAEDLKVLCQEDESRSLSNTALVGPAAR